MSSTIRFPTLALPRSGSMGMISGSEKPPQRAVPCEKKEHGLPDLFVMNMKQCRWACQGGNDLFAVGIVCPLVLGGSCDRFGPVVDSNTIKFEP
jgi:hypothetical protein